MKKGLGTRLAESLCFVIHLSGEKNGYSCPLGYFSEINKTFHVVLRLPKVPKANL